MNHEQYSILALRTAAQRTQKDKLLEAVMGIGGEAGEIVDMHKKHIFYDKPLNRLKTLEEVGDLLWYANLLIHSLESSWDEVFEMNIRKLETRYPGLRFDAEQAINRDVVAENIAISNVFGQGVIDKLDQIEASVRGM